MFALSLMSDTSVYQLFEYLRKSSCFLHCRLKKMNRREKPITVIDLIEEGKEPT